MRVAVNFGDGFFDEIMLYVALTPPRPGGDRRRSSPGDTQVFTPCFYVGSWSSGVFEKHRTLS